MWCDRRLAGLARARVRDVASCRAPHLPLAPRHLDAVVLAYGVSMKKQGSGRLGGVALYDRRECNESLRRNGQAGLPWGAHALTQRGRQTKGDPPG